MSDSKQIRRYFLEAQMLAANSVDLCEYGQGWLAAALTELSVCESVCVASELFDAIGQVTVYGADYAHFAELADWDGEPSEAVNF